MNPILTAIDEITSWEGPNMRWLRSVTIPANQGSGCGSDFEPENGYRECGHCGRLLHAECTAWDELDPGSGASGCSSNFRKGETA